MKNATRVVILGGGFGGAYCARRLARHKNDGLTVTVLDRHNYLLFYPLLVEAGTGSLEPRHAAVPLRDFISGTFIRMGDIDEIDMAGRRITYRVANEGPVRTEDYDHLVVALGSVTNLPPVPGLLEHGFKFKTLADAVSLRDRMVQLLEMAEAEPDPERRKGLLHVVVVGANFTGVEVAGEYLSFLKATAASYPHVDPSEIRVTVVEMMERILGAMDPEIADYVVETMGRRGVSFKLKETVKEIGAAHALLSSGERLATQTVIWCAGIAPNPLLEKMSLPTDKRGWVLCENDGRVKGLDNVWAIGDCAVNLDPKGRPYPPTAQAAVGEGESVADNIARAVQGKPTLPIDFHIKGTVTPIGGHAAVVSVGKRHFSGFIAWFIYRSFYLLRIPGFGRKARVGLDWFGSFFTTGDAVQLNRRPRRAGEALAAGLPRERPAPEPASTGAARP